MSLRKHMMATTALGAAGAILAVDPFGGGPTLLFAAAFGFVGLHTGVLS